MAACLFGVADLVFAQPQSQIQYGYDAAGNLIQITRSTVTPKPDLTVSNLSVGTTYVNVNGSFSIPLTFQVNNTGNAVATATWYDRGYLSANTVLHDTDQMLGGFNTRSTNLAASGSYIVSTTFTTTTTTTPGNYTLIVKADGGASSSGQYSPTGANYVAESDETNNTQSAAINLPANALPDLTMSNASVGTIVENQDASYSIPVTFTVNNVGNNAAQPRWFDMAYLSTNGVLDNSSVNLSSYNYRTTALAAGSSYAVTMTFPTTNTTAAGSYTLFIKADGHSAVQTGGTNTDNGNVVESNETNNAQALPVTLPGKPDLTVSNASVGTIAENQDGSYSIPVTFTVNNVGASAAQPRWFDMAYLSTNGVLDNSSVNLSGYNYRTTALAAGSSYTVTITFPTPNTTAAGNYTLFIKADGHSAVQTGGTYTDNGNLVESNESNNTQALPVTLPGKPDLAVSNASVGSIVENQDGSYSIPVTFTVNNSGASAAQPRWFDLAYLSTNGVLDNSSVNLSGYNYRTTALAAGSSYTVTITFTATNTTAAGTYTLFIKADGHAAAQTGGTYTDNGNLVESNESNNTQALALILPSRPDLSLSNMSVATVVKNANGSYNIPVTYTVNNIGNSAAQPRWFDLAYLSTNGVLDNSSVNLSAYNYRLTALAAGSSYSVTTTFTTTTTTAAGSYTLFVKADGHGSQVGGTNTDNGIVAEANESNNVASQGVVLP